MQRILMTCAAATMVLAMGVGGAVSAAEPSPCKGLAEDICKTNKVCSWVKARKTKAGKETAGFCRKKPVRTKAAPAATTPKT